MKGWVVKSCVIGGVLLVAASAVGFRWLNQPVIGTTIPQVRSVQAAKPVSLPLESQYFTSQVNDMRLLDISQQRAGALDRLRAASIRPIDGDQLAVTINTLPPDGLGGVADVRLRLMPDRQYERLSLPGLPEDAMVFRQSDHYEVTVFWPHEGMYAAISVTGRIDRKSMVDAHLTSVVSNWQWR